MQQVVVDKQALDECLKVEATAVAEPMGRSAAEMTAALAESYAEVGVARLPGSKGQASQVVRSLESKQGFTATSLYCRWLLGELMATWQLGPRLRLDDIV